MADGQPRLAERFPHQKNAVYNELQSDIVIIITRKPILLGVFVTWKSCGGRSAIGWQGAATACQPMANRPACDFRTAEGGGGRGKGWWSATRTAADDCVNSLVAATGRSLAALMTVLI